MFQLPAVGLGAETPEISISFHTEGPELVQGLKTWIAFEIKGMPQDMPAAWGAVYNSQNIRVTLFSADADGRGEFWFIPGNDSYYAELYCGKYIYQADLPVVQKSGYTIEIDNVTGVENAEYGRVYSAEQSERMRRFVHSWGGSYFYQYEDIEKVGEPPAAPLSYLQRWCWKTEIGKQFQGKYLAKYPATRWTNEYSYWQVDDDDIKVRISRTEDIKTDTLILSLWKDDVLVDRQPVCMKKKDAYLRFLLRYIPEGEIKFTLTDRKRLIAERWVDVLHYNMGRSYLYAKARDVKMLCRSKAKEIRMQATVPPHNRNINIICRQEGGSMLADARCIVAFQAKDDRQQPADIYGVVRNSAGQAVAFLETYAEGLGSFELLPDGKPYKIYYSNGIINGMQELQAASEEGYTLEADCISQLDDGHYGQEYTQDQKEQIMRLLKWFDGTMYNNIRNLQKDPLWTIKRVVKECYLNRYPLTACEALRITVRKRSSVKTPLYISFIGKDKVKKRRLIEQPEKLQRLKTWIPLSELLPGQSVICLEDENGQILVKRKIDLSPGACNYRQAKIQDLKMILE